MICKFCGNELSDEAVVCSNCGNAVTEEQPEVLNQEDLAETAQDNAQRENIEAPDENVVMQMDYREKAPVRKSKKKFLVPIIAGGAALLIIAIVAAVLILSGTSKKKMFENQPLVYIKEDCTMISSGGNSAPFTALDECSDGQIKTSDDGKHIFYSGENPGYSKGVSLYYRRTKDSTAVESMLASGVEIFDIPEDGSYVVYITKDKELYFNDLKENKLLSENASGFVVCEGGKYILYITEEDRALYIFEASVTAEPQLIEEEIEYCDLRYNQETEKYCYDDGVYFKKDGTLYYKKHGKHKVSVIDEVDRFYYIGKTLYAATSRTQTLGFDDVVTYDCEEEDEYTLDSSASYSDEYKEARYRELIKEAFGKDELEQKIYTIYEVNGSKTKPVKGEYLGVDGTSLLSKYSKKQKVLDLDSVNSSDSYDEAFDVLLNFFEYEDYLTPDCYLTEKGSIINLKNLSESHENVHVTENEKYVYSLEATDDEDSEGRNLNKYKVESGGVVFQETLAENVDEYVVLDDDFIVVYMYVDDEYSIGVYDGDLKILAKQPEDLYHNALATDNAVYFIDNEGVEDEGTGMLLRYVKGKGDPQVVAEKVSTENYIVIRSDNECYYIKNVVTSGDFGELYYNKDGKEFLIDEDVYNVLSGGMPLYYD